MREKSEEHAKRKRLLYRLLEEGIRAQFHRGAVVGSKFERPI